jgi:hypothetical protein
MPKSFKHYKTNKKRRRTRRRRTVHKKRISRNLKGGDDDNVKCCICEKMIKKDDTLIPRECLKKYGKAAHRICQNCWWNEFAVEGVSHKCPGCEKGLPLTEFKNESPVFIDLT